MASLVFTDVDHVYRAVSGQVTALDGVDLAIEHGEAVAILGPSGCGKSTTLLLAAGLLAPSRGTVLVDGRVVEEPRRETALILQDFGLLPWKTVSDNAALGLSVRGMRRAEAARLAAEALSSVGLAEFARSFPGELSGGMRQRLALARALALDADLVLMDEPLSAVDSLTREELQDMLLDLWLQRGHTQVLVTHSIEEAAYLGRRVVVMTPRPGRIHAVVDNPGVGDRAYRTSPQFLETCAHLRSLLVEEGALHR